MIRSRPKREGEEIEGSEEQPMPSSPGSSTIPLNVEQSPYIPKNTYTKPETYRRLNSNNDSYNIDTLYGQEQDLIVPPELEQNNSK